MARHKCWLGLVREAVAQTSHFQGTKTVIGLACRQRLSLLYLVMQACYSRRRGHWNIRAATHAVRSCACCPGGNNRPLELRFPVWHRELREFSAIRLDALLVVASSGDVLSHRRQTPHTTLPANHYNSGRRETAFLVPPSCRDRQLLMLGAGRTRLFDDWRWAGTVQQPFTERYASALTTPCGPRQGRLPAVGLFCDHCAGDRGRFNRPTPGRPSGKTF